MLDFSKDEVLTRKEYLKQKKQIHKSFKIIKYALLVLVIVGLSLYVFKQIKTYNAMNALANKVVEQAMLNKTYKMYFMGESYTKESTDTSLYLYTGFDESRKKIDGGENLTNISFCSGYIYGIKDGALFSINQETNEINEVYTSGVVAYEIVNEKIVVYVENENETAVFVKIGDDDFKKIIDAKISQLLADENNIFVVVAHTTEKTLVKYDYLGNKKGVLSTVELVSYMVQDEENIYFSNASKNGQIYGVSKDGGKVFFESSGTTYLSKEKEQQYNGKKYIAICEQYIVYINNNDDDKIYILDKNSKEEKVIVDNPAQIIQARNNVIYFKLTGKIGIYKYDILKNEMIKITSARTNDFFIV